AIVTPPPRRVFLGRPVSWQLWAADPSEPAGILRYSLSGDLPKGLNWDAASHSLKGAAEKEGRWPLVATVRNQGGAFDTMNFVLNVRRNTAPVLARPPKAVAT